MEGSSRDEGVVVTVLGPIDPSTLGRTLMHEHLIVDYASNFAPPAIGTSRAEIGGLTIEEQKKLWEEPLNMQNAGHIRCYYNQNRDNMVLDNVDQIVEETLRFKKRQGGAIVECSIEGIGRNHKALAEIGKRTGLHVVMGTGYYLARVHPADMSSRTAEEIARQFVGEITVGVEGSGIRAGIIGELGCSTEITENERKVLRAAALAQKQTGASISIHPGYSKHSPAQVLDILEAEGAALNRVIMGHVDRGLLDIEEMLRIAKRGCVLEFDQFGWGSSFTHALSYGIDYPSDFVRCAMIKQLVDAGFGNQVVMSHDIAFKSRLVAYGGTGYEYISQSIVPYMLKRGLDEKHVEQIMVHTPRRLLTISRATPQAS